MGHHTRIRNAFRIIFLLAVASLPSLASIAPNVAEQYLLAAANQDRAARNLPLLHFDPILAQAAFYHAHQMAAHANISHQFPGEPELSARGASVGAHFSLITENVGEAPDSTMIHGLWMQSKGHRENLLDPNVDAVGISVVVRNHQLYAVEDFASTVKPLDLNEQESTVANILAQSGLQIANNTSVSVEDARRTCTMSTGYAGNRQPWYIIRYNADKLSELPSQLQSHLNSGTYHQAAVGACISTDSGSFTAYGVAVLLYP
ncbi:MAG: SCP-like extracellular protein [Edaphobacter sp.]|nr:SCP-like extracellular protein [Edaphobacter sp.]